MTKHEWLALVHDVMQENPEWLQDTISTAIANAVDSLEAKAATALEYAADVETVAMQFYNERKMASLSEPNRLRVLQIFKRGFDTTPFFARMKQRFGEEIT